MRWLYNKFNVYLKWCAKLSPNILVILQCKTTEPPSKPLQDMISLNSCSNSNTYGASAMYGTFNSYNPIPTSATGRNGGWGNSTQSEQQFIIEPSDVVFVIARQFHTILLEKQLSGLSSLSELVAVVDSYIGEAAGLVTLQIRNRDRGCSMRKAVRFRPSMPMMGIA